MIHYSMRAAIYLRVSTDEQAESGLGLAAQEERCRALALAKGWQVIDIYRDEGVSGTVEPIERPAGSRLLGDAAARRFDVVLALKIDRLARRAEWIHRTLRELEALGVAFTSVSEPVDTASAMGKAFLGITAVFAELERNLIAERTKQALAVKKSRGERLGAPALGTVVRDGMATVDTDEAATVAHIRTLKDEGLSLRAIAARLAAEGRRTKKGGRWAAATILYVLRRAA